MEFFLRAAHEVAEVDSVSREYGRDGEMAFDQWLVPGLRCGKQRRRVDLVDGRSGLEVVGVFGRGIERDRTFRRRLAGMGDWNIRIRVRPAAAGRCAGPFGPVFVWDHTPAALQVEGSVVEGEHPAHVG